MTGFIVQNKILIYLCFLAYHAIIELYLEIQWQYNTSIPVAFKLFDICRILVNESELSLCICKMKYIFFMQNWNENFKNLNLKRKYIRSFVKKK
jgi:hypothetical protein